MSLPRYTGSGTAQGARYSFLRSRFVSGSSRKVSVAASKRSLRPTRVAIFPSAATPQPTLGLSPGQQGILLNDFRQFVKDPSEAVKDHAMRVAVEAGRPYEYPNDHDLREDNRAYGIAARDQ